MNKIFISIVVLAIVGFGIYFFTKDSEPVEPIQENNEEIGMPVPGPEGENTEEKIAGYTLAEVALHSSETDCWTSIEGKVYNLTPFIEKHPGGKQNIMKICGKDGSELFGNKHGDNPQQQNILKGLEIGVISE